MDTAKVTSAMSSVLRVRELECVKFRATLMDIFSERVGSCGQPVMQFKESSEMTCLKDGIYRRASAKMAQSPAVLPVKPPFHRPFCLPPSLLASLVLAPVSRVAKHDNTRTAKTRISTIFDVSTLISSAPIPSQESPAGDPEINITRRGDAVYSRRAKINRPRPVVSNQTAGQMHENARRWRDLNREVQLVEITKTMASFGITPPDTGYPATYESANGPIHLLNRPFQRALSELARRSASLLPEFVDLVREQTERGYRPNKNLVPAVHGRNTSTWNTCRKSLEKVSKCALKKLPRWSVRFCEQNQRPAQEYPEKSKFPGVPGPGYGFCWSSGQR
ncbi:hypothetical protein JG688_00015156 [Phytophthora aleatoria]|uniref:Uncharacterized protein n=1 Tax=Phytophthora aleatoria TaxID=2496075 RepID=A0A8J5IID0_9STRA|nr:hypothetical protein JG688_00015156 [Phytophthora aleatoria]